MRDYDKLQRRLATNRDPGDDKARLVPKADLYIAERLDWHGPLPSAHLYAYYKELGYSGSTYAALRLRYLSTIKDLSYKGKKYKQYLETPIQQFPINPGGYVPGNHRLVYSLGEGAVKFLKENTRYVGYHHGSTFEHQLGQSIITSEIELGTFKNRDFTFKPRHRVLSIDEYKVNLPELGDITFQDDGAFAINYGDRQDNFFIELDRSTEMSTKLLKNKKTVARMILQWHHFIQRPQSDVSEYRKQTGCTDNAYALFYFTNETRMKNVMEWFKEHSKGKGSRWVGFRYDGRFHGDKYPAPTVSLDNYHGEYLRVGHPPFKIDHI